jgi:hypothetical protein
MENDRQTTRERTAESESLNGQRKWCFQNNFRIFKWRGKTMCDDEQKRGRVILRSEMVSLKLFQPPAGISRRTAGRLKDDIVGGECLWRMSYKITFSDSGHQQI